MRSIIEVLTGRTNNAGLFDRDRLRGQAGDAIRLLPSAAGQDLRLTPEASAAARSRR